MINGMVGVVLVTGQPTHSWCTLDARHAINGTTPNAKKLIRISKTLYVMIVITVNEYCLK